MSVVKLLLTQMENILDFRIDTYTVDKLYQIWYGQTQRTNNNYPGDIVVVRLLGCAIHRVRCDSLSWLSQMYYNKCKASAGFDQSKAVSFQHSYPYQVKEIKFSQRSVSMQRILAAPSPPKKYAL